MDWARKPLAQIVRSALVAGTGAMVLGNVAQAAPQGGQISAGSGSITRPDASTTTVTQNTAAMVVDWQSFNVATHELVQFKQPSASASVLNNIHDANPSQIMGRIEGNGRVFLSNPNGIVFGPESTVNLGSLVATTHRVSADDFMAGNLAFENVDGEGVIVNQGLLEAATGGSKSTRDYLKLPPEARSPW